MGGGDLNMKKSWHPGLIKNRAQVWEDQHAALQERKRVEALRKEIEEERAANELQRLNEANGGAKRQERVEFLYAGPGAGGAMGEDREAYLLGRKRIDDVLGKDNTGQELGKPSAAAAQTVENGINMRDVTNKISQDPLLAIKRQEAAQYQALVNRKKAELEAEARKAARRSTQRSREATERHHSSRRRDDERTRGRDGSSDERDSRREHSHRSSHRRRSDSRDRLREERHHSSRHDRHYRAHSPESRRRDRSSSRDRDYKGDRHYRASSSSRDHRRSRHPRSPRSRSPSARRRRDADADRVLSQGEARLKEESHDDGDAARAARLAAMTDAAVDLDGARAQRLEESRKRDEAERIKEISARSREARIGENSGFVRSMQLSAGLVR